MIDRERFIQLADQVRVALHCSHEVGDILATAMVAQSPSEYGLTPREGEVINEWVRRGGWIRTITLHRRMLYCLTGHAGRAMDLSMVKGKIRGTFHDMRLKDGVVVQGSVMGRNEFARKCECEEKMGNEFWFLPVGACLREDKVCSKP